MPKAWEVIAMAILDYCVRGCRILYQVAMTTTLRADFGLPTAQYRRTTFVPLVRHLDESQAEHRPRLG